MKIIAKKAPEAQTDKGFFRLSYGVENPHSFSLHTLLECSKEEIEGFKKMFPERWSYQLYYRYKNGSGGILFFSNSYQSREALEADFNNGIPVSNPSDPVVLDAIEAFAVAGAIQQVEES